MFSPKQKRNILLAAITLLLQIASELTLKKEEKQLSALKEKIDKLKATEAKNDNVFEQQYNEIKKELESLATKISDVEVTKQWLILIEKIASSDDKTKSYESYGCIPENFSEILEAMKIVCHGSAMTALVDVVLSSNFSNLKKALFKAEDSALYLREDATLLKQILIAIVREKFIDSCNTFVRDIDDFLKHEALFDTNSGHRVLFKNQKEPKFKAVFASFLAHISDFFQTLTPVLNTIKDDLKNREGIDLKKAFFFGVISPIVDEIIKTTGGKRKLEFCATLQRDLLDAFELLIGLPNKNKLLCDDLRMFFNEEDLKNKIARFFSSDQAENKPRASSTATQPDKRSRKLSDTEKTLFSTSLLASQSQPATGGGRQRSYTVGGHYVTPSTAKSGISTFYATPRSTNKNETKTSETVGKTVDFLIELLEQKNPLLKVLLTNPAIVEYFVLQINDLHTKTSQDKTRFEKLGKLLLSKLSESEWVKLICQGLTSSPLQSYNRNTLFPQLIHFKLDADNQFQQQIKDAIVPLKDFLTGKIAKLSIDSTSIILNKGKENDAIQGLQNCIRNFILLFTNANFLPDYFKKICRFVLQDMQNKSTDENNEHIAREFASFINFCIISHMLRSIHKSINNDAFVEFIFEHNIAGQLLQGLSKAKSCQINPPKSLPQVLVQETYKEELQKIFIDAMIGVAHSVKDDNSETLSEIDLTTTIDEQLKIIEQEIEKVMVVIKQQASTIVLITKLYEKVKTLAADCEPTITLYKALIETLKLNECNQTFEEHSSKKGFALAGEMKALMQEIEPNRQKLEHLQRNKEVLEQLRSSFVASAVPRPI